MEALAAALRAEYHVADGHITVTVTETDDGLTPMDAASTERAITLLLCAPNGVVEMSMDVPDLVQTSLNLGRLTSDEASLRASFMIRSSINSQKNAVASRLARLGGGAGRADRAGLRLQRLAVPPRIAPGATASRRSFTSSTAKSRASPRFTPDWSAASSPESCRSWTASPSALT